MHTPTTVSPVSVQSLSKRYGNQLALKDATFTLQEGEIFGLIGLNGAGKTTLIKVLLNLIRADAGEAQLFGLPASNVASRKKLSYLPEKFQPSRYLTGWEFLTLSAAYFGQTLNRARTAELVASLDLDPAVLKRRVGTYSKGMGQKLGLASALAIDVPLLLLDEPMSGLDPRARVRLKQALFAARTAGRTLFFSSHILSDVDELCDRIAVLHEGIVHYVGTPSAFKEEWGDGSLERAFLKLLEDIAKTSTGESSSCVPSQVA